MAATSQSTITSRNHLLHTKLRPPLVRATTVTRNLLADYLARGESAKLVLVVAPAGYGKSTFLSQWTKAAPRKGAWFTVEKTDNDPGRFWSHFFAAFDAVLPEFAEYALEYLTSPGTPTIPTLLSEFINEISSFDELLVVLDDYHTITGPAIHSSVTFLLDHLPANLQVAVGSRTIPPLPVAKLRAQGEALEIDASSLRATQDEAERFFLHSMNLELHPGTVQRLLEKTEGWFVGLQLAALTLRGGQEGVGGITQFGADNRFVLEYLTSEVLNNQPDEIRRFLIATSLFPRFTVSMCDFILQRSDSQEMLERLEAGGVFIMRLDDESGWFRYHALWAELLQRYVVTVDERAIHARAAEWLEGEGLTEEAVRHHLASGDTRRAAELIEAQAMQALMSGRAASLMEWLEAIPEKEFAARPRLLLTKAWAAFTTGMLVVIPDLLEAVRVASEGLDQKERDQVEGEIAGIEAEVAVHNSNLSVVVERSRVALQLTSDDNPWLRARMFLALGIARYFEGEWEEAFRSFYDAKRVYALTNGRYGWLKVVLFIGNAERCQGNLRSAERHFKEILADPKKPRAKRLPIMGRALIGLGKLAYDRHELDAALALVQEGNEIGARHERSVFVDGALTLALVQRCMGDHVAALSTLDKITVEASMAGFGWAVMRSETLRMSLLIAMGELGEPERWLEVNAFGADDVLQYSTHMEYVTVANFQRANGDLEAAVRLLRRLVKATSRQGRICHQLEVMALLSGCLLMLDERETARGVLAQALEIAEPEGHARSFLQDNEVIVPLLRELASTGVSYATFLLGKGNNEAPDALVTHRDKVSDAGIRYEPLTDKERTVLRLLISGMSNKEIARESSVSVNTVKTHVRSVYGKLLVSSRSQLVARALELELMQ